MCELGVLILVDTHFSISSRMDVQNRIYFQIVNNITKIFYWFLVSMY